MLDAVVRCVEATNAPLKFDILKNFNFDDPDHRKEILKNPYLLVGNLGQQNYKYTENPKFYKALDLTIHSRLVANGKLIRLQSCLTSRRDTRTSTSLSLERILKESTPVSNMRCTQECSSL